MRALGNYILLSPCANSNEHTQSGLIIQRGLQQYQVVSVADESATVKVGDIVLLADENDLLIKIEEGLVATITDNLVMRV